MVLSTQNVSLACYVEFEKTDIIVHVNPSDCAYIKH